MTHQAGKGSKRRRRDPRHCTRDQYERNHDRIWPKRAKNREKTR